MTDCVTYHYDSARSGQGGGAPEGSDWHKYLAVNLGSAVRGAPLFLENWLFENGPRAGERRNVVFVCTSDNHVYAFAEDQLRSGSSTPIWSQFLGNPVIRTGTNFFSSPIGVCSTATIDKSNQRMFVLSFQDVSGTGVYFAISLDLDTGDFIQKARLYDAGAAGRPTFDGNVHDQRGALNLVNGRIVATFADLFPDDVGPYHGWVVSCNANNLTHQWYLSVTNTVLGGGCWGPGGAAAAPDGTLYVGTGNAGTGEDASGHSAYWAGLSPGFHPGDQGDFFEAVVKIDGSGGGLQVVDWYQPVNAQEQNFHDLDFGSSSPLILPDIGGMKLAVISVKFGIYLLNREHMGHWGGELWKAEGADPLTEVGFFPERSFSAPAYYAAPAGDHLLYFVGAGVPGLIAFKVEARRGIARLKEVWRANGTGIACGNFHGSPTIGSVDSPAYALVWIVDFGASVPIAALRAFDALTGSEVFNSTTRPGDDLGEVPHFPSITCAGRSVFVGTSAGFACYAAKDTCQSEIDAVNVLERQIAAIQGALDSGEIPPPPATPAKVAQIRAQIQRLRKRLVQAQKALQSCQANL